ncbi:hypothetical protein COO60DRAFT_1705635 [Scenedesmus sp. NREL 46B-D3]|nr:hypothetical protein COO60DRAFT_1705635 [Scenedesmus sp. NREL 46B-D3]
MHPANLYCQQEPDFAALAELHPPLAPYVSVHPATSRGSIDFTSWHATQQLTAALLAVDFGIHWSLPEGQLVPPVPNRANYVHWLHDLLQLSAPPGPQVHGLDVGCGANFIYCLLGAALYGWRMTGVDVTQVALQGAAAICEANPRLAPLLEVRQSRCSVGRLPQQLQQPPKQQHDGDDRSQQGGAASAVAGPLLGAMADTSESFAFCMCNPPFFGSISEANQNPNTACGGTAEEMVVEGGELAFVRAMIADSRVLRGRVHWYSSMCGKKATLKVLRQDLHGAGVTALRTTELVQGKTSRWAIAWSFAASPNTANKPLPRRNMPQQQHQHQQHKRAASSAAGATKLSFRVSAPAEDGRKLLQALGALLTAVGQAQGVQVDMGAWKVTCHLPAVLGQQQQQQQGQQQQQQGQQQEQAGMQQHGVTGSSEHEPALKRARSGAGEAACGGQAPAGVSSAANSSARTAAGGYLAVEVSVFQQQRGSFDVAVAGKGPRVGQQQLAGAALLRMSEAVREDLTLMWPVGPLQLL